MDGARDYRLMRRSMVDAILSMREYNRFSKGIFGWVGFKTKWVPLVNVERIAGETKWSFWKLFPLLARGHHRVFHHAARHRVRAGRADLLIAFVFVAVVLVKTLVLGDPVGGWPSTMCVILFLGGVQLLCIGILGQYLARTIWRPSAGRCIWCARPRRASDEQAVRLIDKKLAKFLVVGVINTLVGTAIMFGCTTSRTAPTGCRARPITS